MSKKILLPLLLCSYLLQAQQGDTLLQEVTVVDSRYSWLQASQYQFQSDSISFQANSLQTMAVWLPLESSVHLRQYAPGMVATYSAHGATSQQNAILWNGFNLNGPGTGLTDVSLLPNTFFNPSLLRGGSAALFGSGAVGSVVNLIESTNQLGWHASIQQKVASFGTLATGADLQFANARWLAKSDFYHEQSENSYPYTNPYGLQAISKEREGAAYKNTHVKQDVKFQVNKTQYVDASVWYNAATRETPNGILTQTAGNALLTDRILRSRLGWHFNNQIHKIDVAYSFINEWQRFEDQVLDIDDTNKSGSHILRLDYLAKISNLLYWQNGYQARWDDVSGSNRSGSQHASSLQSGLVFNGKEITAQATLRAEIWNDQVLPLSPFASVKWQWFQTLSFSAFGGYNYRIPSMNDRFWQPGGNVDLEPEQGWGGEAALSYYQVIQAFTLNGRLAYYHSSLSDYIQWVPGQNGIWSPHNVKKVNLSGIDVNASVSLNLGKHFFKAQTSWSENQSIIKASHVENDQSVDRQLVYQPERKITSNLTYGFAGYYILFNHRFVGRVFTDYTQSNNTIPAYHLFDATLSKRFKIKPFALTCAFGVKNIGDEYYENIAYYPMPGRNYSVTLKLEI